MPNKKDSKTIGVFKVEQLKADSGLYEGYSQAPYNHDVIVQKKGDFSIYDKMRRDDQVKAVLWLKKFMILSTGWDIKSNEDKKDEQKDVRKYIKEVLSNLSQPNFIDALVNILTYIDYGFSITEPVFGLGDNNQIGLSKLKTRAPHTFLFETDDYGNMEKIRQYTAGDDVIIQKKNIDKLIYMTHQQEFGNPYGVSDLQACYRAWFSKDIVIRFWNMYLERFGSPHFIATTPTNLGVTERANLKKALKTMQASTGILIPDGVNMELVFPSAGNTGFEAAIDKYNMMIARSMLIPDLIGIGGKEISGGSYALGEKHFDIFFMTISKYRGDLELMINRKIIQPLSRWNFGLEPEDAPRWVLNPLEDSNKQEYLKLWTEAIKGKIWKASDEEINHFRDQIKFPSGDIERAESEPSKFPGGLPEDKMPGGMPGDKPEDMPEMPEEEKLSNQEDRLYRIWQGMKQRCLNSKNKDYKYYGGKGVTICNEWKDNFSAFKSWALSHGYSASLEIDRKDNKKGYNPGNCRFETRSNQNKNRDYAKFIKKKRPLTTYEKKVDFAKIERVTEELDKKGSALLRESLKPIKESFLKSVKPAIKARDIEKLRKVELKNLSGLRMATKSVLLDGFEAGMISAKSELPAKRFALPESAAKLFDESLKARAYFITGVIDDTVKRDVFQIIGNHIDKGFSVSETMFTIDLYFEDNFIKFGAGRLETIVRTNNTKAYNYGRRKVFEDPELEGFVQAYQFSAILDDRTSDICNSLDNRIAKINDPYINKITPPLHYNCRSLLVPIVEGEQYEISPKINLDRFGGIQKGVFV